MKSENRIQNLMHKIVFFFFLFIHLSKAQNYFVNEVNVFEGISNIPIYSIQSDREGFLYLSTEKGLIKYNGIRFNKLDIVNASSESFNQIYTLSDGKVLAINFFEGIFELNDEVLIKKNIFGLKDYKYTFLNLEEFFDKIYLVTDLSVFVLDKEFKLLNVIDYRLLNSRPFEFNNIVKIKDTLYVLNNSNFLLKIDRNGNIFKEYIDHFCSWYGVEDNKTLYLTCRNKIAPIYQRKNGTFTIFKDTSISLDNVTYKIRSIDNYIFLCTSIGLMRINKDTKKSEWLIKNKRINDITKDYQGNFWAVTLDGELLNCYAFDIRLVQTHLNQNITNAIKINDESFLMATSINNFYKYDIKSGKIHYLGRFGKNGVKFLIYDSITNTLFFQSGTINLNTNAYENFYSGNYVAKSPSGDMIYCTGNKIFLRTQTPRDSSFKYYPEINAYMRQIYESRSYKAVYIDTIPYILLFNGVAKYVYDSIIFVKDLLTGNIISGLDMTTDSKNNLWVISSDYTLNCYHQEFLRKKIDIKSIFSKGSSIIKITFNRPYIMVFSQNGLILIHEETYEIINLNNFYGNIQNKIKDALIILDTIYSFHNDNILIYNINKKKDQKAKIFIKKIVEQNSEHLVSENNTFIKTKQSTFFVHYEILNFGNQTGIKVAYRIRGIDTTWNYISTDITKLFFPYLNPGIHTIEMTVLNENGQIISDIKEIKIVVPKPFFASPFFYMIVVVLGVGILALLYYLNEEKNKKKELINNQLRMSKLTALRSRMNPHFVYNVLNSIQSLIYIGDKSTASNSLSKFSELMRLVLDLSDKENICLNDEIRVIELYLELEKLRFGDDFKYTIEVDNELKYLNPEIPGFFIQPFVENSIKHGLLHKEGQKRLLFKIEKGANNDVRVIVDDNGIGRKKSAEINARRNIKKSSFAVEAIINRINLINSQLKRKIVLQIFDKVDLNNEPSGTTVIISIPVELDLDT